MQVICSYPLFYFGVFGYEIVSSINLTVKSTKLKISYLVKPCCMDREHSHSNGLKFIIE